MIMNMVNWICNEGFRAKARTQKAAQHKMEKLCGAGVTGVRLDAEADFFEELPDCNCGWRGQGTGPGGIFLRGDRCPECGMNLY